MNHEEMVAWLRKLAAVARPSVGDLHSNKYSAIAAELERLRHMEVEHQGCEENAISLLRERDAFRRQRDAEIERVKSLDVEREHLNSARDRAVRELEISREARRVVERERDEARSKERGAVQIMRRALEERDAFAAAWDKLRAWAQSVRHRPGSFVDGHLHAEMVGGQELLAKLDELDPRKPPDSASAINERAKAVPEPDSDYRDPDYLVWSCKIGVRRGKGSVPYGGDFPMRRAVKDAFHQVLGLDDEFCFSGWAGALTEGEAAFVEHRYPGQSAADVRSEDVSEEGGAK